MALNLRQKNHLHTLDFILYILIKRDETWLDFAVQLEYDLH